MTLGELLNADAEKFLVPHSGAAEASSRRYLVAWGLAYYLAFERPLVGSERLDLYVARDEDVARDEATMSAIERFERLVGQPLPEFETTWRAAMLAYGRVAQ